MSTLKRLASTLMVLLATAPLAQASGRIDVVFVDPGAAYSDYYADILRVTVAAGDSWMAHFAMPGAERELTVSVGFAPIATASGRSVSSAYLATGSDGLHTYAQGAAHEINTGIDANGSAADIEFQFGIGGYLQTELWFDPDPLSGLANVPADRVDAYSLLLHEFGHALGFNGWRDELTGQLPGDYASSFDALVAVHQDGLSTQLSFIGESAVQWHGGPVPLTPGNYGHLGLTGAGLSSSLGADLMNGLSFARGVRYEISALDLLIMQDIGLNVITVVPEPASAALWLLGLGALTLIGRRRSPSHRS